MRSLIVVLLIAFASVASAGSIRPAAVSTDTVTVDPGLRHFVRGINASACATLGLTAKCTQAEATAAALAKNVPAPTIYATTVAGYEAYLQTLLLPIILDHARQGFDRRATQDVLAAYKAASPALQADIETRLGVQ